MLNLMNSNLPTIKQLQCFLVVSQELNFRKAAERLRMSQPPLTRQIHCLEDVLKQQLFHRNTREVHLTEAGRNLTAKVENILREINSLKGIASVEQKAVRIGLTRNLNFENISPVDIQLRRLEATDDTDTPYLTSSQLLQCLSKNTLDIVVTGELGNGQQSNFDFKWVCQEPLLLAMPASHPASIKEKVSLKDVSELSLFWFPHSANPTLYEKCEAYFSSLHTPLKRIKEPDDSLVTLSRIARGKGIALLPQSMCTFNQEGLCYRELSDDAAEYLNIGIYVAIRKDENRQFVLDARDSFLNSSESI